MKFDHLILVLVLIAALPIVSHAEVYKWKDKDGNTRYSDTPPPSNIKLESIQGKKSIKATGKEPLSTVTGAQPVAAPSTIEQQKVTDLPPPESTQDSAAKIRQQNAESEKKNKQEKETQAKLKTENCKAARANLQSYVQGGRVYKINEKGEREYLDDAGLKQGADKARAEVSEYCS